MRTECTNNTDFQGKLVIANSFSNKPKQCINKVQSDVQNLIKKKDYDLYIRQDYSKNVINISAEYSFPLKSNQRKLFVSAQENIPINSRVSRYVDAAANVINQFENNLRKKEQQAWEQKQKKQNRDDIKNTIGFILLSPVYFAEMIVHDISPKWGEKFENLLQKIGI